MMQTTNEKHNYCPQEIIDEIVDHVAAMKDSSFLRSCSLASSAFQNRAQFHLFRALYFDGIADHASIIQGMKNLQLAFAAHPKLASYTQCLSLAIGDATCSWVWDPTFLSIVKLLDNLEEVSISSRALAVIQEQRMWLDSFWNPFIQPRIIKLSLKHIWDYPLAFIIGCPKLKELSLETTTFSTSTSGITLQSSDTLPLKPIPLTHLQLRGQTLGSGEFLESWEQEKVWDFFDFANLATVDCIFYNIMEKAGNAWLSRIFDSAGAALSSLIFRGYIASPQLGVLSLSKLTSLSKMSFRVTSANYNPEDDPILAVSDILATLDDTHTLQELDITLQISFDPLKDLQWLFRHEESCAFLDDIINYSQNPDKRGTCMVIRIDYFGDRDSVENSNLLEEFNAIRAEKLPLIDSNPLVDVRFFTQPC